jgi:hypothetical protein
VIEVKALDPVERVEVFTVEMRQLRKIRGEVWIDRIGKSGHHRDRAVEEAGMSVSDRVEIRVDQIGRPSFPKRKARTSRFLRKRTNRRKTRRRAKKCSAPKRFRIE